MFHFKTNFKDIKLSLNLAKCSACLYHMLMAVFSSNLENN